MSVELVAAAASENTTLERFPAVLGEATPGGVQSETPAVGKYHCLISRIDNQLVVWDLGAPGGTLVNGSPVTKASLRAGDTLRLGGNEFTVKSDQHRPQHYLHGVRS